MNSRITVILIINFKGRVLKPTVLMTLQNLGESLLRMMNGWNPVFGPLGYFHLHHSVDQLLSSSRPGSLIRTE